MSYNVMVTTAGSAGGENLIRSIRKSDLAIVIYGCNMDPVLLKKSQADFKFCMPGAADSSYIKVLNDYIKKNNINLLIPNSDKEVGVLSRLNVKLSCNTFLPSSDTVEICQDKFKMYEVLSKYDVPVAKTKIICCFDDIHDFIDNNPGEKYWIRTKRGAGSIAATWVYNAEQAQSWIKLWIELRGFKVDDFTISEFLPGRDYAFQSVWLKGNLMVAKLAERLEYYMGKHRLSGMSSTPSLAKTIRDDAALETIFSAIKAVSNKPNGNFCLDLKGNQNGEMCITEFNIGRFMNITPIHDLTGKYNTADIYIKCALGLDIHIKDPIDIQEGQYLIRELDTEPLIISEADFHKQTD